jgi:hypothetical protein
LNPGFCSKKPVTNQLGEIWHVTISHSY